MALFSFEKYNIEIEKSRYSAFKTSYACIFGSELFTFYLLTIFKQWLLLPLIWKTVTGIHAWSNITEKLTLLKKCGPQIWYCLFMVWPIRLKQLKNLTSNDSFSCLGGAEGTLQTLSRNVSGSIPGWGKEFYVCFLLFCCCAFMFWPQNVTIYMKLFNSFC